MEDEPGSLGKILGILDENDINLSYLYAFVAKEEMAIVLLHPENIDESIRALQDGGADLISAEEIYSL